MISFLKSVFSDNINCNTRQQWIQSKLSLIPAGSKLLDAGAGQLLNKKYCDHLDYVSQDFCQYTVPDEGAVFCGLHTKSWDTSNIDLVSDITCIPANDGSFDVILCSEVLEHVPEPTLALDEFYRLLRPGGLLIVTAPFSSHVHMAPYHYCSGFSRFWYSHHLEKRGFLIKELSPNGDFIPVLRQELCRLGSYERQSGNLLWPLAYAYGALGLMFFRLSGSMNRKTSSELTCFGWHCLAERI